MEKPSLCDDRGVPVRRRPKLFVFPHPENLQPIRFHLADEPGKLGSHPVSYWFVSRLQRLTVTSYANHELITPSGPPTPGSPYQTTSGM